MHKNLILLRHGLAGDREEFRQEVGLSDDLRPLTVEGRKDLKKTLSRYQKFLPEIEAVFTSPLLRAVQTAEIAYKILDCPQPEIRDFLKPFVSPQNSLSALLEHSNWTTAMIVGHEPHLSRLLSYTLTGAEKNVCQIKKGGLAWIELSVTKNKLREVKIKCLLQPSQTKKIIKKDS